MATRTPKARDGKSIAVEGAAFAQSVHGEMHLKCTDCHADVSAQKLPHPEKLKPVACANCHDKAAKEYSATVHGIARKGGNNVAAACTDCHGLHDIRRAKDPASRTNHANLEATCGKCHGNDAMVASAKLPGGNIVSQFHDSIHGKALTGAAAGSAPTCTNCHGAHTIRAKSDPDSATNRARIPDTCGSCHKKEREQFAASQHGKMRQEGNLAAPGCNDCHSAHRIQQHEQRGVPDAGDQRVRQLPCGLPVDLSRHVPRPGHGAGLRQHGDVRVVSRLARNTARVRIRRRRSPRRTGSRPVRSVTPARRRTSRTTTRTPTGTIAPAIPLYYYAAMFMEWLLIGVFGVLRDPHACSGSCGRCACGWRAAPKRQSHRESH